MIEIRRLKGFVVRASSEEELREFIELIRGGAEVFEANGKLLVVDPSFSELLKVFELVEDE